MTYTKELVAITPSFYSSSGSKTNNVWLLFMVFREAFFSEFYLIILKTVIQ